MRVGSLCSGYEGLGLAVQDVFPNAELAWVSDIDKGACKILAHHYPDVPNIGDMTKVKWVPDCPVELGGCGRPAEVLDDRSGWQCHRCGMLWPLALGKVYWPEVPEPVDIIIGGTPCQDLSHAGKRAGMTEGTRSNLWVTMREAIAVIRPKLVIWENVGGAYSAEADSDLESDPGLLGGVRRRPGEPVLRALGRVLGDLATLGFDAEWHGLRAADVGAPHGRLRVFLVAYPAGRRRDWGPQEPLGVSIDGAAAAGGRTLLPTPRTSDTNGAGAHGDGGVDLRTAVTLLPTPAASDTKGSVTPEQAARRAAESTRGVRLPEQLTRLLPTPAVNDMGEGKTVDAWDEWTAKMKAAHGNGNGHGASLAIEAQRLLPTPKATNNENRPSPGFDNQGEVFYYAPAIARWEQILGRAPHPHRR